ncbi:hypothetical protein [Bacillus sp. FJAT-27225]|nr:hypothetical protein [Bacillus sp. FJAT-27225]
MGNVFEIFYSVGLLNSGLLDDDLFKRQQINDPHGYKSALNTEKY